LPLNERYSAEHVKYVVESIREVAAELGKVAS